MKSNSYKIVTALRGCNVRFEKRAREFVLVVRLIYVAVAKASVKARSRFAFPYFFIKIGKSESLTITGARPEAR